VAVGSGNGLGDGATAEARVGEGLGVGPVIGEGAIGEGVAATEADNVEAVDGCAEAVAAEVANADAGLEVASDTVHPTIIAASVHSKASMRVWFKVFPLVARPRLSQPNRGPAISGFPHIAS